MNFSPYQAFAQSDVWFLLAGATQTILLTVAVGVLATGLGLLLGWLRFVSTAARILTTPAVDVLRSIPLLVQLILINTVVGVLEWGLDPLAVAMIVLTLYATAFGAEIARGGFAAVDKRQRRAARSLGMTALQEFRYVLMPLAARAIYPSWVGLMLSLVKDSALVSAIGLVELMKASQVVVTRTNDPFLVFGISGLIYFAICYPCSVYSRRVEARMKNDLD